MRDTTRRYVAILRSLTQLYGPSPRGHRRQHLIVMALMICGATGSRHCHLPQLVHHTPGGRANDASVVKRFERWLRNEGVTYRCWMLPVAKALLVNLSSQPLHLVIDGSTVGSGCIGLMVSVLYRKRALPLAWLVVRGEKGHLSDELHRTLIEQIDELLPAEAQVVLLGDGEFDGTTFLEALQRRKWDYVCRTTNNITVHTAEGQLQTRDVSGGRGTVQALEGVRITAKQYGPVSVVAVWEEAYEAPLYLVTNMTDLDQAVLAYRCRAQIETFFADQKSRGFQVHRSHMCHPERLTRLLLVLALAYLWVVYLGTQAAEHPAYARMLGRRRCDLSLFQLGFRLVAHCLRFGLPFPRASLVALPAPPANKLSVR